MLIHGGVERLSDRDLNRLGVVLSVVGGDDKAPLFFALSGISTPELGIDGVLELFAGDDNVFALDVLGLHLLVEDL